MAWVVTKLVWLPQVSEIEDLKRRVEEAQLQNTEAQQLEARLAAQQAVAARLPVLRTQKDKMEAEVAEVDQLEARLKELNEQVGLRGHPFMPAAK